MHGWMTGTIYGIYIILKKSGLTGLTVKDLREQRPMLLVLTGQLTFGSLDDACMKEQVLHRACNQYI